MVKFEEIQFTKADSQLREMDEPSGSEIPKTGFAGERIFDRSFVLKTATDGASLISESSLFHSKMQLG